MSAWTDLGLPLPNAKGYGYQRDAGLIRSPFPSPLPDQKQSRTSWSNTFTTSWDLTLEQLAIAETYLLEFGYSWFDLELVSGETPAGDTDSIHTVRLVESYKVQPIAALYMRLSANMESKVTANTCSLAQCDDFSGGDPSATCDLA